MGHVRVVGGFCCSAPQYGRRFRVESGDPQGNTQTHTGTYTQVCTHPLTTYPLKSAQFSSFLINQLSVIAQEETKGRLCKRAVLANVPLFWFLGSMLRESFSHLDSLTLDKLEHDALASWLKLLSLPTRKELSLQLSMVAEFWSQQFLCTICFLLAEHPQRARSESFSLGLGKPDPDA